MTSRIEKKWITRSGHQAYVIYRSLGEFPEELTRMLDGLDLERYSKIEWFCGYVGVEKTSLLCGAGMEEIRSMGKYSITFSGEAPDAVDETQYYYFGFDTQRPMGTMQPTAEDVVECCEEMSKQFRAFESLAAI